MRVNKNSQNLLNLSKQVSLWLISLNVKFLERFAFSPLSHKLQFVRQSKNALYGVSKVVL